MENTTEETSNDQEEMKEKVHVSLAGSTITQTSIGLGNNSNASVWSLCDINNDDTHVDLGDITPSISPVFTEEQVLELSGQHQMVDSVTHRLLDVGDNIFSVGNIDQPLASEQQKSSPLHDLSSDLEMFGSEMPNIEEFGGVRQADDLVLNELGLNNDGEKSSLKKANVNEEKGRDFGLQSSSEIAGKSDDSAKTSSPKTPSQGGLRRSLRKPGSRNESSPDSPESGMALRRSQRQNQPLEEKGENEEKEKSGTTQSLPTTKNREPEKKVEHEKVKRGPSRRSSRIAKHVEKEPEQVAEVRDDLKEETESERDNPAAPVASESKDMERNENVDESKGKPLPVKTETEAVLSKTVSEKEGILPEIKVEREESNILTQNDATVTSKPTDNEVPKKVEDSSGNLAQSEARVPKLVTATPEKRVTRSTTGNLKPKQTFDEIQEKHEEKSKRVKKKAEDNERLKAQESKKIVENDDNKKTKATDLKEPNAEQKGRANKSKCPSDKVDTQNPGPEKTESKSSEMRRKGKQGNAEKSTKILSSDKEKDTQSKRAKAEKEAKSSAESSEEENQQESESESSEEEVDCHADDSDYSPEDDPDRPWCICRKPHGNRFMICCDGCEEWFHGKCVGITMEQGRQMEKNGQEYVCTKCKDKRVKALMEEKERSERVKTATKSTVVREVYKHTRNNQKEISQSDPAVKPSSTVSGPSESEEKTNESEKKANESEKKTKEHQEKAREPDDKKESDEKKRKHKEPGGFKIPKKVRTTPTPASHTHQQSQKCIGQGCPRSSFEGAVYCGRSCIERHVNHAVRMLSGKEHGGKLHTSEGNRVAVIEKSSGRVIAGMAAPVMNNLTEWILKNPSFEVLISGSSPTGHPSSSFYNKPTTETKIKKEVDRRNEEETIRSNVRRTMKEVLVARKKESTDIRISVEEIMKLVRKIEEDMHKAFKDTSHRYKAKYRTLMFNLKDPRNKVLYRRVLTGDIPAEKLVWMTSDELATKELAEWREQETRHMIDMIKKEEENSNKARLIKKTHKGEVDVDGDDDFSTLESSNSKEEPVDSGKTQEDEKSEVLLIDTTDEHRAHLFDLNCKICTGKMAPPGEVVAKSPTAVASSVPIQAAAESSIPSPPREVTFAGPPSPDSHEFATTSSTPKVPSKVKEKAVWKGFVMMQSVAKFGTNAYLVSGSADDLIQVLPDTLHVHGRIAHEQVWDYVFQCKTSTSREMCLIRFAAATDEEKISYVSMYSYFHSRKRCGVIGNCYSGVKDMYLIPLASHQPVPPELMPFKGPGLQEPRPHMLLGLIIRSKPATKRPRSVTDRLPSTTLGEPSSKRSTVNGTDTSKSTTPNSKSTTPTLPDSPVDEIEDIVFHFHNSQAKLDAEPAKPQPSSTQPVAPMVNTLLQIQEQEKKLRALQEQSKRLEEEIAPKKPPLPNALSLSSLSPSVSSVLSRLTGSSTVSNIASQQEQNKSSTQAANLESLYDPETAYDEETPYDPDDLDLSMKDDEVSGEQNEESRTVQNPPTSLSNTASVLNPIPHTSLSEVRGDVGRVIPGITTSLPQVVPPDHSQARIESERVRPDPAVVSSAVDRERTAPRPMLENPSSHEQYEKRSYGQSASISDGRSRGYVSQDPRNSRYRNSHGQDMLHKDFPETRDYRENRRNSDDSRRDSDESKFYSSRSRPSERRWSDDRGRDRYDSYRYRDDRQRGFFNRDRSHDRDRHSRDRWRR